MSKQLRVSLFRSNERSIKDFLTSVIRNIALCIALSTFFALVFVYWASHTGYFHNLESVLDNGIGIYETLFYGFIITAAINRSSNVITWVKRALQFPRFTWTDVLFATVFGGWNIPVLLERYATLQLNVKWTDIDHVVFCFRVLSDIGLLWLVARVAITSITHYRNSRSSAESSLKLLTDRALGGEEADIDLLNRDNIVNALVRVIQHNHSSDSLAIALTGEWGEGKSSIVNFALRKLNHEMSNPPLVINFDPWYFGTEKENNFHSLLSAFMDGLRKKIAPEVFSSDLDRLFRQYYRALLPVLPAYFQVPELILQDNSSTIESLKQEIENAIISLKRKIVVVIEDIDRMDGSETLFVFRLLRLCADFKGFVYIVPFDSQFVIQRLTKEFDLDASDYLEKIFQVVLPVPKIEESRLVSILENYISKLYDQVDDKGVAKFDNFSTLTQPGQPGILDILSNVRRIKRALNNYFLLLPILKHEVNHLDLFLLEVIRSRFPDVYEQIYQTPQYFTYITEVNWSYPSNDRQVEETQQFYQSLEKSIPVDYRQAVMAILGALFNSVQSFNAKGTILIGNEHGQQYFTQKRIAHPYYFPRYFYLGVQSGVYSDEEWAMFIETINKAQTQWQMNQLISEHISFSVTNGMFRHWLSGMSVNCDVVSSESVLHLIPAMIESVHHIPKPVSFDFDFLDLVGIINSLISKLSVEDAQSLLKKIAQHSSHVYSIADVIYGLSRIQEESSTTNSTIENPRKINFQPVKQAINERFNRIIEGEVDDFLRFDMRNKIESLERFSENTSPEKLKSFTDRIITSNDQNALRFLEGFMDRQWHAWGVGLSGKLRSESTRRVLFYQILKSYIDPQTLYDRCKDAAKTTELSLDQVWALEHLQLGIKREEAGENVEYLDELDEMRRRPYVQNEETQSNETLPDILSA